MSNSKEFTDRFKKMKSSIEKNKKILNEDFPEDVKSIGNPDFIKNPEKYKDNEECQKEKK